MSELDEKREIFAALAMQGILAGQQAFSEFNGVDCVARSAVAHADALIAELEKPK